jgi:hypothetical protein
LTVPRAAVRAIRQPPGWALVRADDFPDDLKNWKVAGKPARDEQGMVLDRVGQTVEYTLAEGLPEGRVAVSFQESDGPAGAKWLLEADFLVEKQTRRLTVHLAGEGKDYRAAAEGLPGESTAVARSTGRHRAVVQFSATALRVLIDDEVLWHSLKKGPGGRLVRWTIACRAQEPERAVQGKIVFRDFSLHRAIDEFRHPAGDPRQDEVWLLDGDQLFGRFMRADRQGVVIEGRFGRRVLPWTRIRGVFPREREHVAPLRERVRLWLDNGFDSQPDLIEGVVRSLDDRGCVLRHADLGEITLERGRIRRVAWPGNEQR